MKVRKISIATQILCAVLVMFLVIDTFLGLSIYKRTESLLIEQIKSNAISLANCVAASVDGELLKQVGAGDVESEAFRTIHDTLTVFLENADVEYVYTIRKSSSGGTEFAVDSDPENPGLAGDAFDADAEDVNAVFSGRAVVNDKPYTDEWGTHLSAYSPIYAGGNIAGVAVIDISVDWIKEQTSVLAAMILGICIVVMIIGVAVMLLLSRILRTRFEKLNTKVVELTQGNGDLTRKIELKSGDEFEVIGENINELLAYIRGIMLNIAHNSDELKMSSSNIALNLEEANVSATDVSSTMEEMSAIMQDASSSLNQIDGLMADITDAFGGIVKRINEGRNFSQNIKQDAVNIGTQAVNEQRDAKEKADEMAKSVAERIEKSKAVEQIKVLTENILNITSQTNLLALNASIEAARAGESGKGFAVVASEIGNLAQDSANAATEIQEVSAKVISAVDELAKEANRMLRFISEVAMNGYSGLVETSGKFKESAERFDEIIGEFSEISANIQRDIDGMQKSTDSVNKTVEESTHGVVNAAQKALNMKNNMAQIGSEAENSSQVSNALYAEVGKFKLQ
ncbi:MAG: hypothetical protein K6G30_06480 [Acetatifactor sp.]|nr:hypothetical protein [Acetatifactor sp.]